ncbi:MAG: hypothetical protein AAF202_02750 [Pseudomonadota bacterium]
MYVIVDVGKRSVVLECEDVKEGERIVGEKYGVQVLWRGGEGREGGLLRGWVKGGGIKGGKGGFGALLRSSGKGGRGRRTTDFGACRDLSGRRLRQVNDELRLRKWREAEERKEERQRGAGKKGEAGAADFDKFTGSGIPGWHLTVPNWAEGCKVKKDRRYHERNKRKTRLCSDWIKARIESKPPADAKPWWGCPRGTDCEFAHGDEELRGEGREQWDKLMEEQKNETVTKVSNSYITFDEKELTSSIASAVSAGLKKSSRKALVWKNLF